jgi:hypothetical protein
MALYRLIFGTMQQNEGDAGGRSLGVEVGFITCWPGFPKSQFKKHMSDCPSARRQMVPELCGARVTLTNNGGSII